MATNQKHKQVDPEASARATARNYEVWAKMGPEARRARTLPARAGVSKAALAELMSGALGEKMAQTLAEMAASVTAPRDEAGTGGAS